MTEPEKFIYMGMYFGLIEKVIGDLKHIDNDKCELIDAKLLDEIRTSLDLLKMPLYQAYVKTLEARQEPLSERNKYLKKGLNYDPYDSDDDTPF